MDIKHLKLIKYIVESGSMSKSKDVLCLTQSALSHQLKEAESQAGTKLFLRKNKKLILTHAGELVYRTAIDVLEKITVLEKEIHQISKGNKGVIRVCTACFTNYYWLPALLEKFERVHPNVEIKIYPEYINESLKRLQECDLDAVIMNQQEIIPGIQFYEILKDELVALVPPHNPWVKKKFVTASDFEGLNLIIFSKPLQSVVVYNKLLKPAGIIPKHIYEVPMTEAMVEMIISGFGVAVIPKWIAQPYIESSKIIPIRVTSKGLHRKLGVALRDKEEHPEYFKTFISFLKENLNADTITN